MTEIDAPVCAVETSARTIDRHDLPYRVNNVALATNPLHRYCADPNLAIFDGRYFLYCTDDGVDDWGSTAFSVYVSDNLMDWERYPALDLRDVPWWTGSDGAWAPSIVRNADGRYVLLFVADSQIGTAVANTPYGPFIPTVEPIVRKGDLRLPHHRSGRIHRR